MCKECVRRLESGSAMCVTVTDSVETDGNSKSCNLLQQRVLEQTDKFSQLVCSDRNFSDSTILIAIMIIAILCFQISDRFIFFIGHRLEQWWEIPIT